MTCTICGKATGPGTMLCRPCKAALKRARQFTVQELPGAAVAVAGPADSFPRTSPEPSRQSRRRDAEQLRRIALAGLAVLLLAAAAYIGGRGMASERVELPVLTPMASVPQPPIIVSQPVPVALPPPAPVTRASSARARPAPAGGAAARTEPPRIVQPAVSAPVERPTSVAQAEESLPPAPLPAAPAALDRWQVMSQALARCADEGGISGFICDQRVRLSSCDGYWGRVAECPAPSLPANPR